MNLPRWEYLFLEQPTALVGAWLPDQYGRQGWELVAVLSASSTIDRLWFKRRAAATTGTPIDERQLALFDPTSPKARNNRRTP